MSHSPLPSTCPSLASYNNTERWGSSEPELSELETLPLVEPGSMDSESEPTLHLPSRLDEDYTDP